MAEQVEAQNFVMLTDQEMEEMETEQERPNTVRLYTRFKGLFIKFLVSQNKDPMLELWISQWM